MGRDGAGAWRRMTTSPQPLGVVEFPVVRRLLDQDTIVIAAGGGGPPVYEDPILGLEGVDAVVDKDRVSAVLARQLEADVLMILTNVEAVYEGWGTPAARPIRRMTVARAEAMIAAGAFDAGGMRPKVEAAAGFARDGGGRGDHRASGLGPGRPSGRDRHHDREGRVNLHEYQARTLLKAVGIPMFDGDVASTPTEAEAIARRIGGTVVIKAQVHAGGRGKAGGVKLARNPAEAADEAAQILGMTIKGLTVHKVLVVPAAEIATESYVGLIMDRETQRPVFMVSSAGGVDIEEVAAKTPEKIVRLPVDPTYGLFPHQALSLAFVLYRDFAQVKAVAEDHGAALPRLHRQRGVARRDQPAGHHAGRQGARARRQDRDRRQRALLAPRPRPAARRFRGGAERGGGAPRQPDASSSSTATSAAW